MLLRLGSVLLLGLASGCSIFHSGSISPVCGGQASTRSDELFHKGSPLWRALSYTQRPPLVITGTRVDRGIQNGGADIAVYEEGASDPPHQAKTCARRLAGPVFQIGLYARTSPSTEPEGWTKVYAAAGVGEKPFLECLADSYDSTTTEGQLLAQAGVRGTIVKEHAFNGAPMVPAFYAPDATSLFQLESEHALDELSQLSRLEAGEPSRELLEMMRHVDVTRDGFQVMHHRELTHEQRSLEHVRTVTRHFMFAEPGTVRACYGFAFDRPGDAAWAARSIGVMLDILDDWESQGGARDEPPDSRAVIAPKHTSLYAEDNFAGVETSVPLADFGELGNVVDSAVDNAARARTEEELRTENREEVWSQFQPRAGIDFE